MITGPVEEGLQQMCGRCEKRFATTSAGRRVGELAGRHLTRAHLELGGNSALVVLEDADVDEAATPSAFGSFFHQGQICMTTGRRVVH